VHAFFAAALVAAALSPVPETPASESPADESPVPASPATEDPVLESSVPWWERITVTVDDKGKQQSCRYETSLRGAEVCDQEMSASVQVGVRSQSGRYSKVTFERRFSPGGRLDSGRLQPGDTLMGRQVMFLTFDAKGSIESCKVVATTGEAAPGYGCEEARKEQFRAQASAGPSRRQAFMTILAYAHTEQIA
jgi:hypothetical protein